MPSNSEKSNPIYKYPGENGKINVICDTMLWYHISKTRVKDDFKLKHNLIGTYINAIELNATENLIKYHEDAIQAIISLNKFAYYIIEHDPFDGFILQNIDPDYPNVIDYNVLESLAILIKYDVSHFLQDPLKIKEVREFIDTVNEPYVRLSNEINAALPDLRKTYSNKQSFKASQTNWEIYNMVVEIIAQRIKTEGNYKLENCEFFIVMQDKYFRMLISDEKFKAEPNDFNDLMNMVYVGKNDKFYTQEKKWIEFANQAKMYDRYFVSHSDIFEE